MEDKQKAYKVVSNSDLTEGRGRPVIVAITTSLTTAHRVGLRKGVQGTPCPVEECEIFKYNGQWYGPVTIVHPNKQDELKDNFEKEKAEFIAKIKSLGLTEEEIINAQKYFKN